MPLPYTKNTLLLWLDASEKFVNKDSSNKIVSCSNRINDSVFLPESGTAQPTWVDNQVNGYPALSFGGAQGLYYNLPYNVASVGAKKPLIITAVAKIESFSPTFTLAALRDSTNPNTEHYLFGGVIGTNKISCGRIDNDNNSDFATAQPIDSNWHIFTTAYDGTSMKLRVDGVEVNNKNVTSAVSNFNGTKMFVGSAGGSGYFTGKIAEVAVYTSNYGAILDYNVEQYFKQKYFNISV